MHHGDCPHPTGSSAAAFAIPARSLPGALSWELGRRELNSNLVLKTGTQRPQEQWVLLYLKGVAPWRPWGRHSRG